MKRIIFLLGLFIGASSLFAMSGDYTIEQAMDKLITIDYKIELEENNYLRLLSVGRDDNSLVAEKIEESIQKLEELKQEREIAQELFDEVRKQNKN